MHFITNYKRAIADIKVLKDDRGTVYMFNRLIYEKNHFCSVYNLNLSIL